MSRIKRSNKNKKNNELKKILGLALAIGIMGTATSYAYFSSSEKVSSNLKVTMGSLDTVLKDDGSENTSGLINISNLKPNNSQKDAFKIDNTGTLKQKIKIKMNVSNNSKELLSYINGELILQDSKGNVVSNVALDKLFSGDFIDVVDLEGNSVIINSNETLTGNLEVTLKENVDYKYENTSLDFDISVRGTQVNNKNLDGFK